MGAATPPRSMRTFLIIWLGQLISVIGSSLTSFALGVWLYEQSGKATPFALVALAATLPPILLSPVAGVLVDRWDRRTVMIAADTGSAIVTAAIAALWFNGSLAFWHVYLLAIVGSAFGAFQEPAYTASVTLLVPKDDLTRAAGLMQTGRAVSSLVGALLAGVLYVSIGMGGVMAIDLATFLFAVGTLLLVRIPNPEKTAGQVEVDGSFLREAGDGWRAISRYPGLLGILLYFAAINFFVNMAAVTGGPLILSFAQADTLGIVQAVGGAGMLVGSIVMSAWGGPERKMSLVFASLGVGALGLALIGLRPSAWTVGAGHFVLLGAIPFASAASQAIWQVKIPPEKQGRVFATRAMISRAAMPVAFLLAGPLADRVFEPLMAPGGALAPVFGPVVGVGAGRGMAVMFLLMGVLTVVATLVAASHPRIRNIEVEIPDALPDEPATPAADGVPAPGGALSAEPAPTYEE